jgi:hypothetical protein
MAGPDTAQQAVVDFTFAKWINGMLNWYFFFIIDFVSQVD